MQITIGFLLAIVTSHVWFFGFDVALTGISGWSLNALAAYLLKLGYAISVSVDSGEGFPEAG